MDEKNIMTVQNITSIFFTFYTIANELNKLEHKRYESSDISPDILIEMAQSCWINQNNS